MPAGASTLDITFQHLSPVARENGRVVVTREMLNLQWNDVVVYPAGFAARGITVRPSLRLPQGWSFGTALRGEGAATTQQAATPFSSNP